jgi:predicted permease
LLRQLRAVFRRGATDRELDEEIRVHLEMEIAKNVSSGMPPDEACRQALAVFGGRDSALEAHRDVRGGRWIEDAIADARYAFRTLRQNPALTTAAILTIALGVGANTAIFSTLHAVVLRPLPFREGNRLVMLWEQNPERGWYQADAAPANFFDWREQVDAFEDIAAYPSFGSTTVLNHQGEAQLLSSMTVTGNFFSVLGVTAAAGRTFTDDETWDVGERRAMISQGLWRTRFGSDPSIIDRTIDLGGFPVRVIGVVPASFALPGWDPDVWRPTEFARAQLGLVSFRRAHWLKVIGRMKPGVSAEQADAELQVVVARLQRDYPVTNTNMGAGLTPLHRFLMGDVRQPLFALQAAVALLLLIACANVGNLLLVRAADRERESVVRLALGAARGRLVRQALTESLVISTLGGVAGIAAGWAGTRALAAMQPERMLPVGDIGINMGVLLFALAITVGSGLLFGIGPAVWARHRVPADVLKEGGRSASRSRLRRWSQGLAVAELATAVMLMAGAGLLVRSWWRVQAVDPGLDPEGMLSISVNLPPGRFDTREKREAFYDAVLERLGALPGAVGAATVSRLPMTQASWSSDFAVAGRAREAFGIDVLHREISPRYHDVLRVPLLAGRSFTDADGADAPPVVLINNALARKYFANEDPLGKRVAFDRYPDSTSYWRTIVGVVGSERQEGLETESRPEFFAPVKQDENGPRTLLIRTTVDPATLIPSVRAGINAVNPGVAINRVRTMSEIRDAALARRRFVMTLVITFAVAGLLLSLVGVYGVMAQLARGQRRELGIRVALGAPLAGIQMLVVRKGLGLAMLGASIGILGAVVATRAMAAMLYGVAPSDPMTLLTVAILLMGAAVGATLPPARRAARVDPIETLRIE